MSRRVVLWVAFALVHIGVAVLGFVLPNAPMGDVYLVYEPWSGRALAGSGVVGITEDWVYPQLALLPMLLAQAFSWAGGYVVGWAIVVTLVDALGFAVLVGRGHSGGRAVAAWFWLGYLALLGPVAMYRIDAITVPIAIVGCLWLVGRPWLASALLTAAVWIKVWPAALLAAAFVALRRRLVVAASAATVSILIVAGVVVAGGASHLFGFVGAQTGRGLQLEAPVTTWFVWQALAGVDGAFIYYDQDLNTIQATGPGAEGVIAAMTPLLAIVAIAVLVLGAVQARRGASFAALFPPLALALVVTLIAGNKVGSPQFLTWLIAPIVISLVLDRRRAWPVAVLALALAGLTQLVYPLLYADLMRLGPAAVAVLSVRNAGTVALLVWSIVRLARVHVAPRAVPSSLS